MLRAALQRANQGHVSASCLNDERADRASGLTRDLGGQAVHSRAAKNADPIRVRVWTTPTDGEIYNNNYNYI